MSDICLSDEANALIALEKLSILIHCYVVIFSSIIDVSAFTPKETGVAVEFLI